MSFKVTVVYDFDAVADGELTVRAGDVVTITDSNVGQGWVYGIDDSGREGMIPEGYLEQIPGGFQQVQRKDTWDDEWDSDEEFKQESVSNAQSENMCDYLKGVTRIDATRDFIVIEELSDCFFQWQFKEEAFTCSIGAPRKSSKFGGMKSFMAYPVTPSFSNIQVSRRYKHFDWLHERLVKKFGSIIPIPPLPEKQAVGRFEEDLIEHRRIQLQSFADRICRHPVLSTSEVWKHFITETDDKKWTQGKRKVEADSEVGISFLNTIQAPAIADRTEQNIDNKVAHFNKDITKMQGAIKHMRSFIAEQKLRLKNLHNKEYKEFGKAFSQLGATMAEDAPCFNSIGSCYEEMSSLWEEQSAKEWEPLQHLMHDYKGITAGWQTVLSVQGNLKEKQKEIEKCEDTEKINQSFEKVNKNRVGVEAERSFFKQELGVDMTQAGQVYFLTFHLLLRINLFS